MSGGGGGGVLGSKRSRTSSLKNLCVLELAGKKKKKTEKGEVEKEMDGECAETLTPAKSLRSFSLTLRGKSERVGRAVRAEGTQGAPHRHTRPQIPSHRLLLRLSVPGGAASGAVKGVRYSRPHDDPALGLQRRTGRPPALGARSPAGLRAPAEGKRFRAPRASSSHSQPCGSRTRRSCCNQGQDWPIVLARSRLLSPGPARPGRPWPPAPWLSPA